MQKILTLKTQKVTLAINNIMKKIILLILLSFLLSCKTQEKIIKKETNYIINLVVSEFKKPLCLDKNTFFKHSIIKPNYLINHYFRIYNSSKKSAAYHFFYEDIDGIILSKELKKMKAQNLKWSKKEWNKSEILNNEILLVNDSQEKCSDKEYLKISEPVFTEDMNKAIVYIVKSRYKSGNSSFTKVLKKEKGVWKIKGGIPIGIGG